MIHFQLLQFICVSKSYCEVKFLIYSEILETMIMQTSEILESAFSPQCQCVPWISNFHSCKFLFGSVHTKNVRILGVRKKG